MTTTHPAPAGTICPPSDVVNLIIPWTTSGGVLNVGAGDITLQDGAFARVESIGHHEAYGRYYVRVQFEGRCGPCHFAAESLTAVRRYVTEED